MHCIILNGFRATSVNNIYRRTRNGKVFKSSPHKKFCEKINEYVIDKDIYCCEKELKLEIKFYLKGKRLIDLDNMLKSLIDSLQGVCFKNDNQICSLHVERYINQLENKIDIQYYEIDEEQFKTYKGIKL